MVVFLPRISLRGRRVLLNRGFLVLTSCGGGSLSNRFGLPDGRPGAGGLGGGSRFWFLGVSSDGIRMSGNLAIGLKNGGLALGLFVVEIVLVLGVVVILVLVLLDSVVVRIRFNSVVDLVSSFSSSSSSSDCTLGRIWNKM